MTGPPALRRSIGLFRATAMVAGIIIGASIFAQPSLVTGQVPSVGGALLVWAVAGALTLAGSLVIAELTSAMPKSGGVYVFLRDAYSPAVGFLWGWAMFWIMHSGIIAAIAVVFARYAVPAYLALAHRGDAVPGAGAAATRAAAVGAVLVLSAVNYLGVRLGSAVQAALTTVKVLAIVLIIIVAFTIGSHAGPPAEPALAGAPAVVTSRAFMAALIAGLFAFGGWHMVSYTADETVDPAQTIPRALLIGVLLVTLLYVALNAAYLYVLPLARVASSTRVAADFADVAVGGSGSQIMSALVILSTLGAMNGVILTGPRVYMAMANDGLLFHWAGAVHPRFRTPHRAIAAQAVWSCVLVATGSYRTLFTRVTYTEWIFFGLLAASLFLLRRRPDYAPAYRVWGFPVLPALFVAAAGYIVVNQIVAEPGESAVGLSLVLSGLPVYLAWARRNTPIRSTVS